MLTRERPAYGRAYGCDMYISIHGNKVVGNPSVRGTEVYYFTPYSQPLAAAISSQISDYFSTNVYSDGADKNRGAKWSYYKMTLEQDFPSVMIEVGFVTNEEDALSMANPNHQKNIAARIVNGIQSYINRSDLSSSGTGADVADITTQPFLDFITEPAETEPETDTATAEVSDSEEPYPEDTAEPEPEDTDETEDTGGDFLEFEDTTGSDDGGVIVINPFE